MVELKILKELTTNMNILYVEDDSSIRETMTQYLRKLFLEVDVAFDGLEGLEYYKKGKYDIVITDLSMPRMNGLDMLSKIKELNDEQAVLITTAHSESEYMFGAIKAGIDGYIIKPFDFEQLNHELFKIAEKLIKYKENEEYKIHLQDLVDEKTAEITHIMAFQVENYNKTLLSMVEMIEQRDTYTAGHSRRVAEYSRLIAKEMGYSEKDCTMLYQAGILHDVGKTATPDAVLLNPKTLNDIEYKLIQEHVTVSYMLLKNIPMFRSLAEIVRSHHERYDGKGYPRGISGDEIPPLARIMIVADAFDAMTTNRIYKARKTKQEALDELSEFSSKQFHPEVVEKALIALRDIKIDDEISQLPKSRLEEERFAYFYKDTLSNAFNQTYLDVVLMKNSYDLEYKSLNIFSIKNFSNFNREHGWKEGDKILTEFSNILSQKAPDSLVFRVFGDDFVLISLEQIELKEIIESLDKLLSAYDVDYTIKNIDLSIVDINRVSLLENV